MSYIKSLLVKEKGQSAIKWGLPIISGFLIILSQPPISLFPLAYIALIPLLHSLKRDNVRHNLVSGFVAGVVSYLGLVYWVVIAMNRYGGIDIFSSFSIMLLLVLYLSVYVAAFAISVPYLEKTLSIPVFISAPVIWVLLEYLRGFLLTGFPWSLFAYSQHGYLPLIQIVSITGTYFISFLIVAVNCIAYHIFNAFYHGRRGSAERKTPWPRAAKQGRPNAERLFPLYAILILLLFIASLIYGYGRLNTKDDGSLKTAIIQGNIPQNVKWDEAFKIKTIQTYYQKTAEAGKDVNLVIWPETAMPFVFNEEVNVNKFIKELPSILHTNLLFGTVSKDSSGKYHNTAYIYGADGKPAGEYSKVHLVPFGEYTPLIRYFPFLAKITAAGGDFHPGEFHNPITTSIGKIGILICYEGIFPSITNDTARRGGQVLVNITNDAWFGRTSAPYQHLAFYIFRAIETDRYVLRAANTGISAIIDPRGRIKGRTDIFKEETLRGTFSLRDGQTAYVRHGDYFVLVISMFLIVFCGAKGIKVKGERIKGSVR